MAAKLKSLDSAKMLDQINEASLVTDDSKAYFESSKFLN